MKINLNVAYVLIPFAVRNRVKVYVQHPESKKHKLIASEYNRTELFLSNL